MFRSSIVDTAAQRRLVVEGKLSDPWAAELRATCRSAMRDLEGRKLVIDLSSLTVISREGEEAIVDLMKGGRKVFLRRRSYSTRAQATCPEMSLRT
jgi:anti-anti-sigma regulatory factor